MAENWSVVERIEPGQLDQLVELFRTTWWASERTRHDAAQVLAGSQVVVGLVERPQGRLIGFCRAITDGRFLAVILDVVMLPELQGRGGGERLIEAMLARPELSAVDSIELVCQPDLIHFYERFGFTDRVGTSLLMRRTRNPRLVGD